MCVCVCVCVCIYLYMFVCVHTHVCVRFDSVRHILFFILFGADRSSYSHFLTYQTHVTFFIVFLAVYLLCVCVYVCVRAYSFIFQAPEADYLDAVVVTILQIHVTQPGNDFPCACAFIFYALLLLSSLLLSCLVLSSSSSSVYSCLVLPSLLFFNLILFDLY